MLRRSGVCRRAAFVTDVEGDLSYFVRYAERSKVISWKSDGISFRDDSSHFVYGGDVFDRGNDITFAKALLAFHDAHPSRVHLILGNRDVNKMVFGTPFERALLGLKLAPEDAQRLTFPIDLVDSKSCRKSPSYAEYLTANGLPPMTTKVTLVQWALAHKMGGATTFEARRRELAQLGGKTVTDETVAQSFLDASRPGGVYYEYLRRGKMGTIVDGTLFVHASVANENVGFVPEKRELVDGAKVEGFNVMLQGGSLEDWVDALNDFKEEGFGRWAAGGDAMFLRQYAHPAFIAPHSILVHPLVGSDGPQYLGLAAVEFLNRSGVSVVCGGHQPAGDTPSIVQQPGLLSIAADNSYCGGDGTRGSSVSEVLLDEDGVVNVHGLRADGTPYEFSLMGTLVGRHLGGGWWVKLKVGEGLYEVQRTYDAYRNTEVRVLTAAQVKARLEEWSEPPVGGEATARWTTKELAPTPRVSKTRRTRIGLVEGMTGSNGNA